MVFTQFLKGGGMFNLLYSFYMQIMEGKWLLCMLLVLGTAVIQAHEGHDDDVIDIEDDLDDVIEEVEDSKPKPETSTPPSPKV